MIIGGSLLPLIDSTTSLLSEKLVRYRPKERLSTTRRGCIGSVQFSGQGIVPDFPNLTLFLSDPSGFVLPGPSLELADVLSGDKGDGDEDGFALRNPSVHDFVP